MTNETVDIADLARRVAILEAVLAMDAQGTGSERLAGIERRVEAWAAETTYLVEQYVGGSDEGDPLDNGGEQ